MPKHCQHEIYINNMGVFISSGKCLYSPCPASCSIQ